MATLFFYLYLVKLQEAEKPILAIIDMTTQFPLQGMGSYLLANS